jgi:hypothetical protein
MNEYTKYAEDEVVELEAKLARLMCNTDKDSTVYVQIVELEDRITMMHRLLEAQDVDRDL